MTNLRIGVIQANSDILSAIARKAGILHKIAVEYHKNGEKKQSKKAWESYKETAEQWRKEFKEQHPKTDFDNILFNFNIHKNTYEEIFND